MTPAEATKDAMLILGESLDALRERRWDGTLRERHQDLLGDPTWTSREELEAALAATVRCAFRPPHGDRPFEVLTDDAWWAIRIVDPAAAERAGDQEQRLRHPVVAGESLPVLVRQIGDPGVDPGLAERLPAIERHDVRPTLRDRLATAARLRT